MTLRETSGQLHRHLNKALLDGIQVTSRSFRFVPGKSDAALAGDEYNDWNKLYDAYAPGGVPLGATVDIWIDNRFGAASIPLRSTGGPYVFSRGTFLRSDIISPFVVCDIEDGVKIEGLVRVDGGLQLNSVSSSPVIQAPLFPEIGIMILERGGRLRASGTAEFISVASDSVSGAVFAILLSDGGELSAGASPVLKLTGLPSPFAFSTVFINNQGLVGVDTVEGDAISFTSFEFESTTHDVSRTQTGLTNVPSFVVNAKMLNQLRPDIIAGSSPLTVSATNRVDPTSGAIAPTLPLAASHIPGTKLIVKKVSGSANAVTITPAGGDTVDGAATLVIATAARKSYTLQTDGISDWMIIGEAN